MERRILAYGHGDKSKWGFPTEADLRLFIQEGVFDRNDCRYHYTQNKTADVIILSYDGLAYGRFEIARKETPNAQDKLVYPPCGGKTGCTYIVKASALYERPVALAGLNIRVVSYGTPITEEQLRQIEALAGQVEWFPK
jgi:hypothetical protein